MTMRDGPSRGPGESAPARFRILAQVLWNLRLLGLCLVGPVIGIVLVATIFGLTPGLFWTAGSAFLFTLSVLAVLVRAEWRRLSAEA